MPGVVAVFTHDDIDMVVPALIMVNPEVRRPALAAGKVRFVGDPVVAVVAASQAEAVDAAGAVIVDYDPLPVVVDPEAALAPDAPLQFEELGTNLVAGFRDGGADPLEGAEVVVRGRFDNQRVAVVPMEANVIAAVPRRADHGVRGHPDAPRVVQRRHATPSGSTPGELRVDRPLRRRRVRRQGRPRRRARRRAVAAARALGRPVKWAETRSENMVAMPHGRAQVQYLELGLRRDGTITGLRCRVVADAGAYAGFGAALAMGTTRMMAQGVYNIPALPYDVAAALTNTTPMGAFRGAGRPEAAAMLERIIDMAADELGIDPVEHPPSQPDPRRRVPLPDPHGRHLRQRRLRRRARRGGAPRRLRRAAGRAGPAASRAAIRCCSGSACPCTSR